MGSIVNYIFCINEKVKKDYHYIELDGNQDELLEKVRKFINK